MRSRASLADPVDAPPQTSWSSLARLLTAEVGVWAVWKGADDLDAHGDLDSIAPETSWEAVIAAFTRWSAAAGLRSVVVCRHVPGQLVAVGVGDQNLFQLDVVDRKLVHGAPAWRAGELLALCTVADGVRRLPAGAEGAARRLADARDRDASRLAAADPESARALGLRGALASSSRAGLALEGLLVLRALAAPRSVAAAIATDRSRGRCPVLAALRNERRVPEDAAGWLAVVADGHEVTPLA